MYTVHPCAWFHIIFHNTDIPDLSRWGTRSSLGVFSCHHVIRAAGDHVMSTSLVSRGVPVTASPLLWRSMERMIDRHRKRLTAAQCCLWRERVSRERKWGNSKTSRLSFDFSQSCLPTTLPLRSAGSRLLSKVWLQHGSSNKWREPLSQVLHECEGVRAFSRADLPPRPPENMSKRKLSKFCSTLWRRCFVIFVLTSVWQKRNETSHDQGKIFFSLLSFFVLLQL